VWGYVRLDGLALDADDRHLLPHALDVLGGGLGVRGWGLGFRVWSMSLKYEPASEPLHVSLRSLLCG